MSEIMINGERTIGKIIMVGKSFKNSTVLPPELLEKSVNYLALTTINILMVYDQDHISQAEDWRILPLDIPFDKIVMTID